MTTVVKIGSLALGARPAVAAIVDRHIPYGELRALRDAGADLLEMRVDLMGFGRTALLEYMASVRNEVAIPMIGTVRPTDANRHERMEIFGSIMPFVDAIDIELGDPLSRAVIGAAAAKTIIVSEHDFSSTPDEAGLNDIVRRSLDQGAHIVKIATMANSPRDVTRLLRFTDDSTAPMVSIAMGPIGTVSRVIAPLFGSLLTYGFVHDSVAPGQLPARKLIEELSLYYPERSR